MSLRKIPSVPGVRVRGLTEWPTLTDRTYVLYWMTAFRRVHYNFALQRAVELANQLGKPLVILEALRCNYRWACDRFHQFVLDGMVDNAVAAQSSNATYLSYVERASNKADGLIPSLAEHACAVVTDDYPCFFHPAMIRSVARKLRCCVEAIDSNTIVPMREAERTFTVAHSYRRAMQKIVYESMPEFPFANPLEHVVAPKRDCVPVGIKTRWDLWSSDETIRKLNTISLNDFDIDHSILPTKERGGEKEAGKVLRRFVEKRLSDYAVARNEPEQEGSSWLSPYLHFGQISPHEVFERVASSVKWDATMLSKPNGKMDGFWNMGENAEAFMDQLMTWREIGFNMCWRERNFDRYESLPAWAQKTLEDHATDERPIVYELEQFDQATTHDPLWNAAQLQLVREGRMHNYLRMLWGKKILHWSKSPREALRIMIELNNKYALDGRDPNSYSGIFWVLGRYDRAWGPERPIFGKIRYMTSESTQNKFHVKKYIAKYS